MGAFDTILYPIKWVVAWILHLFHELWTLVGLDPTSGWSWALSIVGLTVVMRVLLIPLFFKQIRASRGMQMLQPDLQKLQKKYKGKNDPASRQQMQAEMMALYKEHGTNPFSSCLPILAQSPIFFALFRVLYSMPQIASGEYRDGQPLGPIDAQAAAQFQDSTLLGAQLSDTFLEASTANVRILAVVLIVLMCVTTFTTQRQLTMKNMPQSALDNPMARQQRMLMYVLPLVFAFSGVYFPIGVLIYWLTTNLWTMGQQFYTIRRMPAPGSEAEKHYQERQRAKLERKAARKGVPVEELLPEPPEPERPVQRGQRVQPKRKDRQKKGGGGNARPQSAASAGTAGSAPSASSAASAASAASGTGSTKAPSGGSKKAQSSGPKDGKTPQQRAAERHAKRAAQRRAELERRGGTQPGKSGK